MKKASGIFFGKRFTVKHLLWFGLALLLCATMYLQLRHGDYYAVSGLQDRLLPTEAMTAYLDKNTTYTANNIALGETSFEGVRYRTDEFVLVDAQYHLTVNYTYDGTGEATLLLNDVNLLSPDNTSSVVFFAQPLAAGVNQQVVVPVQVDTVRNAVTAALFVPSDGALTINNLQLQTVHPYFTDGLLTALFVMLLLGALWWLFAHARAAKAQHAWVTAVCASFLLAAAASLPFFQQGLSLGHDAWYHIVRVESLKTSLSMYDIFAHMNPYVFRGFGSVEFIYYPNLMLYFPAVLRLLHVSLLLTYKAMFFSVHFLTALCAYWAAYQICKKRTLAMLFASLYTFAAYRLMNSYTRGAVGEVLAMAFLPLVLYGLHSVFYATKKSWLALAFGMFGLVGSHVLSVLIVSLLLVLYCAFQRKRLVQKDVFFPLCKAAFLSLGLCMTWLLPFIIWMQYPTNTQYSRASDLSSLAAQPAQMLATFAFSSTGTSLSQLQGISGEMPLTFGIVLGIGVLLYLFVRYSGHYEVFAQGTALRALSNTCLIGFCVCFYAATPLFPYTLLSKLGNANFLSAIQFPWRFLGAGTLFASALTAIAVGVLLSTACALARPLVAFALVLAPFLLCLPYLDAYNTTAPNALAHSNATLINAEGDTMYMMQPTFQKPAAFATLGYDTQSLTVSDCGREPLKVWFSFENQTGKAQTIRVPLYSFPNARATLSDGTPLSTQAGLGMELLVQLPQGVQTGTVTADFSVPWYFFFGDAVSLLTWAGVGIATVRAMVKRRKYLLEPVS